MGSAPIVWLEFTDFLNTFCYSDLNHTVYAGITYTITIYSCFNNPTLVISLH